MTTLLLVTGYYLDCIHQLLKSVHLGNKIYPNGDKIRSEHQGNYKATNMDSFESTRYLLEVYLKKERKQSIFQLIIAVTIVLAGAYINFRFDGGRYAGIGVAMCFIGLFTFLNDISSILFFLPSIDLPTQSEAILKVAKKQMDHANKLLGKSRMIMILNSINFFFGMALIFYTAFGPKNDFAFGIGIGLAFFGAIKMVVDLFTEWRRSEMVRQLRKVVD